MPGSSARASGGDGAELLHHADAVELGPDVGHTTVLEPVEVHALDPDRLPGGWDPHELLLLRTSQDPPVLAVICLIFNEGWGGGRIDLSADAIRLGARCSSVCPTKPKRMPCSRSCSWATPA